MDLGHNNILFGKWMLVKSRIYVAIRILVIDILLVEVGEKVSKTPGL